MDSLVQRLLDAATRNANDYGEAETGALLSEAAWAIQAYELRERGTAKGGVVIAEKERWRVERVYGERRDDWSKIKRQLVLTPNGAIDLITATPADADLIVRAVNHEAECGCTCHQEKQS